MTLEIVPFLLASIALTISPGPDILFVLTLSVSKGFKHGFLTSLGLVSGIVVHTTLAAFGVSIFIQNTPVVFWIIKIAGALYLLRLAFLTYQAPATIQLSTSSSEQSKGQLFRQGFLMNVLNPKVTLFFLAFLPAFVDLKSNHAVLHFYMLGGIFMLQALLIFGLVSWFASKLSATIRSNTSLGWFFKWLQIVVFVAVAVLVLV